MIRLKCPKCDETLAVADEEAGHLGECTECGAKFRVPNPKARAGSRDDDEEEDDDRPVKRRKPRKKPSDDGMPEKELSLEDALIEKEKKRRLADLAAKQFALNVKMAVGLFVSIVILGVASVYLNRVAIYTMVIGAVLQALTMIMVSALAQQESTLWFFLVRLIPGMVMVYAIIHWDQTKRYIMANIAGTLLVGFGFLGYTLHKHIKEENRKPIKTMFQGVEMRLNVPYNLAATGNLRPQARC